MLRFLLNLDNGDTRLLAEIRQRTGGTSSDVLRWALRWYCAGGPHRHPDDRLPDEVLRILRDRPAGPAPKLEVPS